MNLGTKNRPITTISLPTHIRQRQKAFCHFYLEEALQEAIAAGGGEYRGVQLGMSSRRIFSLVLFNDPVTHTTLALPILFGVPVTADAVRKRIARSRRRFQKYAKTRIVLSVEPWRVLDDGKSRESALAEIT